MKKICLFLMVLLLLSMTACGDKSEEVQVEDPETPMANPVEEVPAAIIEETEEDQTQEQVTEGSIDEGLSPLDLLGSIQPRKFDTMVVLTEIYNMDGIQSKSLVYQKGSNTRTEIQQLDGQYQIVIFLMEEGVTYQYAKGAQQGMKIIHGNPEAMMEGIQAMDGKMELPDVRDLEKQMGEHMTVRRDVLNGEKAIYIEFTDLDQDMDKAIVKMWYSEEYAYPFRYEFTIDGDLVMRTDVTDFAVDIDLDDALFAPPGNVDFMEIDMEGGFTMPEMPEIPENND